MRKFFRLVSTLITVLTTLMSFIKLSPRGWTILALVLFALIWLGDLLLT